MLTRSSLAVILLLITTSLFAGQIQVTNTNDSGPGSLRDAITSANSGDTVVFDGSLSGQIITLTSGYFLLNSASKLTIIGPGPGNMTISGGGVFQHFELENNDTLILYGLTLRDGGSGKVPGGLTYFGGSIYLDEAVLIANNCVFVNNISVEDSAYRNVSPYYYGGKGGAIYAKNSFLKLDSCTFRQNTCISFYKTEGGALHSQSSKLSINNCLFEDNTSNAGGALYFEAPDTVKIRNSVLQNNTALSIVYPDGYYDPGDGGAIFNAYSYTGQFYLIDGCSFLGNKATRGGAIYNYVGPVDLQIHNTTIANNTAEIVLPPVPPPSPYSFPIAGDGGAIYYYPIRNGNRLYIYNSTLSGNKAIGGSGGALNILNSYTYNGSMQIEISHSTITNNEAIHTTDTLFNSPNGYGGGICMTELTVGYILASIDTLIVENSIISGNEADSGSIKDFFGGRLLSEGYNYLGNIFSSGYISGAGDKFGNDPKLESLQDVGNNTWVHIPKFNSLVIDNGNPALIGLFDQRGYARPIGAAIDIGAVEYQGTTPTCNTTVASNGPASLCLGETAVFADNSTGATFSGWFLNGTQIGYSTDTFTYNFQQPGTYNLMQVAANGSCKDTTYKTVEVYDMPQLDILGTGLNSGLFGSSATLDADQGTPGMSYLWSTGDITPSITVTATGTYSVTVTPANGFCPATQTVRVSISTPVPSPFTNLPTFPRGGTSTGPSVIPGPTAPPPPFHQRLQGTGDAEDEIWTFELYPNPATNAIMVSLAVTSSGVERTAQATFNLYTLTGQRVLSRSITDAQTTVDLNLPAGSYIYRVTSPTGFIKTGKLVVLE